MLPKWSKPVRTVLGWQGMATAALMLIAGLLEGLHGAVSAGLGGAVSLLSGGVFLAVGILGKVDSAGGALVAAMRAEAAKIVTIVLLLWLVLTIYGDVVVVAFIGSFLVCTVLFSMAAFVRSR
jgi:ATP synthase protein I